MKRMILFFLIIFIAGIVHANDYERAISVRFDKSETISDNFIGVGVQWSAYPHGDSEDSPWGLIMTEDKWDELLCRIDYMKPRFVRLIDQANWRYFKTLDESGNPILSFENNETKALFKVLDYCQSNNITVMIGEWGVPGHCHDIGNKSIYLDNVLDPRWHNMIADWVEYLIKEKKYTCIKYYDFINEPNGSWSCTKGNFEEWSNGVRMLYKELHSRGLTDHIGICAPGSVPQFTMKQYKGRWDGEDWVKLSSSNLGDILTAYNTHIYTPHRIVREGKLDECFRISEDAQLAHSENKPFILGEIGLKISKDSDEFKSEHEKRRIADGHASTDSNMYIYEYFFGLDIVSAALQSVNAGVDACAVWDLDDAMHTLGDTGDVSKLKRWGFWNILGDELLDRPEDENIRPWFWAWSWLCRYLPPNSSICKLNYEKVPGCELLIGITPNNDISVYVVNNTSEIIKYKLTSKSINKPLHLSYFEYNEKKYGDKLIPYGMGSVINANFKKGVVVEVPPYTYKVLTSVQL